MCYKQTKWSSLRLLAACWDYTKALESATSEVYATCVTDVLRAEDAAKELRTISNYFNSNDMMPRLRPKIEMANFLCRITELVAPVPLAVVVLVIGLLLLCMLIRIIMCCCCQKNTVKFIHTHDVITWMHKTINFSHYIQLMLFKVNLSVCLLNHQKEKAI